MHNPYFQVALTYFRDPFRSVKRSLLISGLLFFLIVMFFAGGHSENHYRVVPFNLFFFIVLFAYWATHLKEQFANARASMTPGFRKIHGIVALLTAIVFTVLLPGVMAPLIGWQPVEFISIVMFLFGAIIWYILRPDNTFSFAFFIVFIPMFLPSVQKGLVPMVLGYKPFQAFIFMVIGVVLSITGIIRYFLLNEEMPEYHLNIVFPKDGRMNLSDLQWQKMEKWHARGWRHWWANKPIANLIYHAQHSSNSYWSRIYRWEYSNKTVWVAILIAILFNLVITVMDFFMGKSLPVPFPLFFATIVPVSQVIGLLIIKNRFMAQDLMMPVRRDSYLKELGMSVALSQFIAWALIIAISILWMYAVTVKPTPVALACATAYSVMMQIWLFGLAVWIFSFRSVLITCLIIYIAIIFTTLPILVFGVKMLIPWRLLVMLFGGLLAAIGLLLTWWGYRRWLVADFS